MNSTTRIEWVFDTAKFMEDIRNAHKQEKNTSLRDLEASTGISASTFSRIDNGQSPDINTFMEICSKLDLLPADYFHCRTWKLVEE